MRVKYIDYTKCIAILCVIVIHICGRYRYVTVSGAEYMAAFSLAWLVRIGVPLFFMCTGALFLHIRDMDIKKLFTKNIPKLIVCLLIYSFIYSAFTNRGLLMGHEMGVLSFLKETIKGILRGDVNSSLWYMYAIICVYLMLPIFRVIVDNASKRLIEYYLLMCFIAAFLIMFINIPELSILATWTKDMKYLWLFLGYSIYIVGGAYIAKYDISKKLRYVIYALWIISLLFVEVSKRQFEGHWEPDAYNINDYLSPLTMIYAIALFILIKECCAKHKEEGRLYPAIRFISQNTLGIYLIHSLVVDSLEILLPLNGNLFVVIPVHFVLALIITVLIVFILRKIPFVGKWVV